MPDDGRAVPAPSGPAPVHGRGETRFNAGRRPSGARTLRPRSRAWERGDQVQCWTTADSRYVIAPHVSGSCHLFEHISGRNLLAQRRADQIEHSRDITLDLVVGAAEHAVTERLEHGSSLSITFSQLLVCQAVYLNDQTTLQAAEIDDEPVDRMLAAKFKAVEAPAAQMLPELRLGRCRSSTVSARLLGQNFVPRSIVGIVVHVCDHLDIVERSRLQATSAQFNLTPLARARERGYGRQP